MATDTTEKKPLELSNANDALFDLKQEFSSIFHSCNFDAFAEASELGFLNLSKSPNRSPRNDPEDKEAPSESENFKPKDTTASNIPQKNTVSSPAIFFSSDVGGSRTGLFNSAHSKPDFQGTPGVFLNAARGMFESPFPAVKDFFQTQEYIDTYADEPLSLIWSNDLFKDIPVKMHYSPDILTNNLKKEESIGDYTKGFEQDEMYPVNFMGMGLGHSNENSKTENDFSRGVTIKREEQEAMCDTDVSIQLDKSFDMRTTSMSQSTVLNKKNSWEPQRKRSDSEDDDDGGFDGKNRSSRGLRVLSLKVKDIVSEKKRTSYKEVAECLIDELGQAMKGKLQGESKDEQNVKRRVYDALNVLIAADILKKEGKAVYSDDKVANVGAHKRKKMKDDKRTLEQNIYDLKKNRKEKVESLKELSFKLLAIKNLIKRNKAKPAGQNGQSAIKDTERHASVTATAIGVDKDSPTFNSKNEEVIKFPFIVLVSSSQENSMNIGMNNGQKKLVIGSTSPFHIFGDIDVLLKLKLHHVPYEFFKENIPREIERYLPKADFEALKHH